MTEKDIFACKFFYKIFFFLNLVGGSTTHTMKLSPSYQVSTRFAVLLKKPYQLFFALIRLLQKIMYFQSKTNFFFQLITGRF